MSIVERMKRYACAPDVFMYGSTAGASVLGTIPWFLVGLLVPWLVWAWIQRSRRFARNAPATRLSRTGKRRELVLVSGAVGLLVLLSTMLSASASLVGFCARDEAINFRAYPWSATTVYPWTDLTRVSVVCYRRYGRGGGMTAAFNLSLKDGAEIDLFNMPRAFMSGYGHLQTVLRGVSFIYDDSQVRSDCNSPLRGLPPL
jgi:hypothetical protein